MSSEPDSSPAAPLPFSSASASPRALSPQGRAAEEAIASAGRLVEHVLGDAPLLSLLASRGIDSARVQLGASLHIVAQQSCEECQAALGALDAVEDARSSAMTAARADYAEFRRAVKAACTDDNIRDPLEPGTQARHSLRSFVVQATASYLAALKTIPAHLMTRHGFDLARTNTALARVQRLVVLDTLCRTRTRQASRSLRQRDRAVARLNTWTRDLLEAVQLALGQQPPATHPLRLPPPLRGRSVGRHEANSSLLSGRFSVRFFGTPGG